MSRPWSGVFVFIVIDFYIGFRLETQLSVNSKCVRIVPIAAVLLSRSTIDAPLLR